MLAVFAHSTVTSTFTAQKAVDVTVAAGVAPGAELFIDTPRTGDEIGGALTVAGWAADPRTGSGSGVDQVDLWAYPSPGSGALPLFLGSADYGRDRADVAALLGPRLKATGYALTVVSLDPGVYDVVVFGHSRVTGKFDNATVVRVTVQ